MSHNFKVADATTGTTYYVSKAGHDSNDGLAPDRPKRTVANYGVAGDTIIVGGGYYAVGTMASAARNFLADGKVVLDFNSNGTNLTINPSANFIDFEIRNAALGTANPARTFTRCILSNCTGGTGTAAPNRGNSFNNCIILGGNVGTTANFISWFNSCIIANGAIINISSGNALASALQNSYVEQGCEVNVGTVTVSQITNNNIQGIVRVSGVDYEVKRNKAGGTINPTPSLADLSTASGWGTIYSQSVWNQEPKFNNAASGNYTLQADSPMIRAALDNVSNIGGFFAQVATSAQNTDDGNAAGVRVIASPEIDTTIPTAYRLKTTPVNGVVPVEGYVDYVFPSTGLAIAQLKVNDLFAFDSDQAGGSVGNNNVVDAQPLTGNLQTDLYAYDYSLAAWVVNRSRFIVDAGTTNNPYQPGMVEANWVRIGNDIRQIESSYVIDSSTPPILPGIWSKVVFVISNTGGNFNQTYPIGTRVYFAQNKEQLGLRVGGYPTVTTQQSTPTSADTLVVPQGVIQMFYDDYPGGRKTHVRVNGIIRQTISLGPNYPKPQGTITSLPVIGVTAPFPAIITAGTSLSFGTLEELSAVNPNRLTVLMRTRSNPIAPTIGTDANGYPTYVDSEWDNELEGGYNANGLFFQQEVDQRPGLIIQGLNVWGRGDSAAPTGIPPRDLAPRWVHIRVYKRNNYSSLGTTL